MSALSRSFLICRIIISSCAQHLDWLPRNQEAFHLHLADGLVLQLYAALQLRDLSARLIQQVLVVLMWISA